MLRAVIVDIGGVLEYTPPTGHTERWERELELGPGELYGRMADAARAGSLGHITEDEYRAALADRLGLTPARVEAFMAGFWAEYLGTLNAELADWFAALRPRYRTGILSNSFVGATERERERYGFDRIADAIVYSHEVGLAKPDPAVYRLVCARLGVAPEEAVFLDDRQAAVAGAAAVGMAGVVFRDNTQAIADLEALLGA